MLVSVITLTGNADAVVAATTPTGRIRFESEAGNAVVYLGNSLVSSTVYGATITGGAGATILELVFPDTADAGAMFLHGTVGQKVHVIINVH